MDAQMDHFMLIYTYGEAFITHSQPHSLICMSLISWISILQKLVVIHLVIVVMDLLHLIVYYVLMLRILIYIRELVFILVLQMLLSLLLILWFTIIISILLINVLLLVLKAHLLNMIREMTMGLFLALIVSAIAKHAQAMHLILVWYVCLFITYSKVLVWRLVQI